MDEQRSPVRAAQVEVPVNLSANRPQPAYVSDHIVELLDGLGIDRIFLLPGSSFRGLHDSLVNFGRNQRPETILCVSEGIVLSAAHGYAKATGRPAACIVHDLVGLMNGSMGVYNASCDRAPILILGGSGPNDPAARRAVDWAHSAETQSDLVRRFVKWTSEPPTGLAILNSLAQGYKIAATAPQGPVYVSVDCLVQEQLTDETLERPDPTAPRYAPGAPMAPNAAALDQAADWLVSAEMPIIFGGRIGATPAVTDPLIELVELTGAAYHDDRNFIGFPTAHRQNLSWEKTITGDADVALMLDCIDITNTLGRYSRTRRSSMAGAPSRDDARVIDFSLNELDVDSWSGFGGALPPVDLRLTADPRAGLGDLIAAVRRRLDKDSSAGERIAGRIDALSKRHDALAVAQKKAAETHWHDTPISVHRMIGELYEAVKDKPWLLTVRNDRSWPEGLWQFTGAGQYLGPDGGGGVGFGPGAAVGAALAGSAAGRFCIGILGDGDLLMAPGALWTAVHYRIPMLLVVNNNATWANDEKHQIEVAGNRSRPPENAWIGIRMENPNVDFATVARGFGAWAEGPVTDPDALAGVFRQAVVEVDKGGVALVDVRTAVP